MSHLKEFSRHVLLRRLKYELRFSCMNCRKFNQCIDLDNLSVGELFERRVSGEETQELKDEISAQVSTALCRTPYLDVDDAHKHCKDFVHQYDAGSLGEVFGRYSDIAASTSKRIRHRLQDCASADGCGQHGFLREVRGTSLYP